MNIGIRLAVLALLWPAPFDIANAHKCDAVLIPKIDSFEDNMSMMLNVLSLNNSSEDSKDELKVSLYGALVPFNKSSQYTKKTLNYYNYNFNKKESISHITSEIPAKEIEKWAECILEEDKDFTIYFNNDTSNQDSATLYLRRFTPGNPPRESKLRFIVRGGYIEKFGNKSEVIDTETHVTGYDSFVVRRFKGQSLTVEAILDNGRPKTASFAQIPPPPKRPDVRIQVVGHLQAAAVNWDFGKQFNFEVSGQGASQNVLFNSDHVVLEIIQKVDGNICSHRIVSSDNRNSEFFGDNMDSNRQWRLDGMRAGCKVPKHRDVRFLECFVDPLYFTECQ